MKRRDSILGLLSSETTASLTAQIAALLPESLSRVPAAAAISLALDSEHA